jgi:hypothetical protein
LIDGRQAEETTLEIIIEFERPGDSSALLRVAIDEKTVGEHLTAVQAQLLVSEILKWFVLTGKIEGWNSD